MCQLATVTGAGLIGGGYLAASKLAMLLGTTVGVGGTVECNEEIIRQWFPRLHAMWWQRRGMPQQDKDDDDDDDGVWLQDYKHDSVQEAGNKKNKGNEPFIYMTAILVAIGVSYIITSSVPKAVAFLVLLFGAYKGLEAMGLLHGLSIVWKVMSFFSDLGF